MGRYLRQKIDRHLSVESEVAKAIANQLRAKLIGNSIAILARVAAQMGEPDRAIAALEKLLSIPGHDRLILLPLTPALLRLDPMFDPLGNDPRLQKLCEEKPH